MYSSTKSHRRQHGSVIINTAIALSLIVIALIGTELGYLFFMKREFQKTADLAALAGAQSLKPNSCSEATTAGYPMRVRIFQRVSHLQQAMSFVAAGTPYLAPLPRTSALRIAVKNLMLYMSRSLELRRNYSLEF